MSAGLAAALRPDAFVEHANTLALAGWAVLGLAPRRRAPMALIPRVLMPALLGLAYARLTLPALLLSDGGFGSLGAIRTLPSSDALLVAG